MVTKSNITLAEVNKTLQLKSWWAAFLVLPIANRLVVFVVNKTRCTPNQITFLASGCRIFSGLLFCAGYQTFLIWGAFFYYLAYVLDCVDGPVARLTGQTSVIGQYLDHLSDLVGDIFILLSLAWGQGLFYSNLTLALVVAHVCECYISFLAGKISNGKEYRETSITNQFVQLIQQYRSFFHKKNYKSFFSFPDYEACLFILFPVVGIPASGMQIGFFLLVAVLFYTIFSTFMNIHFGGRKFP